MKRAAVQRRSLGHGRPATDRASAFLELQLKQRLTGPDARLPGIRRLAAAAGVSFQTMWRAVRAMAERGMLFPVRGAGVRLHPPTARRASSAPLLPKWRRLSGAVAADIAAGDYAATEMLPSVKELAARHGADRKTMHRALAALVADRLVVPRARGFRAVRRGRSRTRNAILFLTAYRLTELSLRSMETFWLGELVRCLETECSKRSLRFLPVCFAGNEAGVRRTMGTEPVLGCIADTPSSPDMLSTLLADLHAPIAVFDNLQNFRLCDTADFRSDRRAASFLVDQHAVGRQVGQYLFGLGHRAVSFVAPFVSFQFGRQRFQGMHEVYRECGAHAGVRLFDAKVGEGEVADAQDAHVLPLHTGRATEDMLTLRMSDLRTALDTATPSSYQRRIRDWLYPAFQEILGRGDATAWVCANDMVALQALRFLREHGRRVPQDMSLMGFDNSEAALYSRLTSFSFDVPGMALRMLMRVLTPLGRKAAPVAERVVVSTGTVVERDTTTSVHRG